MNESLATRTTSNQIKRGKERLVRDAEDLSAALARFAKDADTGLSTGAVPRIAQDMQQLLINAIRVATAQETARLFEAETEAHRNT